MTSCIVVYGDPARFPVFLEYFVSRNTKLCGFVLLSEMETEMERPLYENVFP